MSSLCYQRQIASYSRLWQQQSLTRVVVRIACVRDDCSRSIVFNGISSKFCFTRDLDEICQARCRRKVMGEPFPCYITNMVEVFLDDSSALDPVKSSVLERGDSSPSCEFLRDFASPRSRFRPFDFPEHIIHAQRLSLPS